MIEMIDVWYKHPTTNVIRTSSNNIDNEYILRGINMSLNTNEIGLLTGKSGTGKTTLLNIGNIVHIVIILIIIIVTFLRPFIDVFHYNIFHCNQ